MSSLLDFLSQHRAGVGILAVLALVAVFVVQWLSWLFLWGRFARAPGGQIRQGIQFVVADFFVKIIDDFRHLLALVMVLVFVVALLALLWPGMASGDMVKLEAGLKAAVASLGSLIAAIIGYYFGESAGTKRSLGSGPPRVTEPKPADKAAMQGGGATATGVVAAPAPPPDNP